MHSSTTNKALVTGANGFVGLNLTRLLLETGREVRALVRPESESRFLPKSPGLELFRGDLRDSKSMKNAIKGCAEIYHVAADYRFWALNPQDLYDSNVKGTKNLLQAASEAGVRRFIHTSTVGTVGLLHQPQPCNENSPLKPGQFNNHYKNSKFQAENLALEYAKKGLPVVVVNPSTPIGPWDSKPTPTGKIIVDFVTGKLPAYVKTGLNFIHVNDVARGHILAAEKGRVGERYILGHQNLGIREFLELLAELTALKPPKIRIPFPVAYMAGYLNTLYATKVSKEPPAIPLDAVKMSKNFMFFDSTKAVKELGLPQTPVKIAAADALEWFCENGYFGSEFDRARLSRDTWLQHSQLNITS